MTKVILMVLILACGMTPCDALALPGLCDALALQRLADSLSLCTLSAGELV